MPDFDKSILLNKDKSDNSKDKPFTFAKSFDVNIDIRNGYKHYIEQEGTLWTIGIKSKNAFSINIIFKKFILPNGAKLFVYNLEHNYTLGAFDCENNNEVSFAIAPIKGEIIFVELFEPDTIKFQSQAVIGIVNHDFLNVFKLMDGYYGESGECNRNINCSEGDNWQNEKQSVCRMIIYGSTLCTGALINNYSNDGFPYFLTANHCYSDYGNYQLAVNNTVFYFNYESPNCENSEGLTSQTISGAALKSNWANSDFCLVQLSSTPPINYNPYYSGWTKENVAALSATGIHHPRGDVKKFTMDEETNAIFRNNINFWNPSSECDENYSHSMFEIWWDHGATTGGSSGSALLNLNKRIVGQLYGGTGSCDWTEPDYYGCFYISWNQYPYTPSTRLKDWLDPMNDPNVTTMQGLRYYKNGMITNNLPSSGDIVKFENIEIEQYASVIIKFKDYFQTNGTFYLPFGASIEIKKDE